MKQQKILDLQQKLQWQKQEIKHLKEKSLWNRSFDTITPLLSKSIFTILLRIKLVFNINHGYRIWVWESPSRKLQQATRLSSFVLIHRFCILIVTSGRKFGPCSLYSSGAQEDADAKESASGGIRAAKLTFLGPCASKSWSSSMVVVAAILGAGG
ncbi:hypothetical protein L1887_16623 [Cichorium endivia]|nr:hypothetical protein L1887_16623 [Cichorium endivia]